MLAAFLSWFFMWRLPADGKAAAEKDRLHAEERKEWLAQFAAERKERDAQFMVALSGIQSQYARDGERVAASLKEQMTGVQAGLNAVGLLCGELKAAMSAMRK